MDKRIAKLRRKAHYYLTNPTTPREDLRHLSYCLECESSLQEEQVALIQDGRVIDAQFLEHWAYSVRSSWFSLRASYDALLRHFETLMLVATVPEAQIYAWHLKREWFAHWLPHRYSIRSCTVPQVQDRLQRELSFVWTCCMGTRDRMPNLRATLRRAPHEDFHALFQRLQRALWDRCDKPGLACKPDMLHLHLTGQEAPGAYLCSPTAEIRKLQPMPF